ncbi:hypothetical protein RAA17_15355 [Komagataeibacter rhaeticus]|nr:hypothetical protein [Komagataeibacter rhaeticus]
MKAAVTMLRRRGRMVMIGYTAEDFHVHPVELIVREITVRGSVGSSLEDLHEAIDLLARGVIQSPWPAGTDLRNLRRRWLKCRPASCRAVSC